jgi:iron complex transport system ATP-binding protein
MTPPIVQIENLSISLSGRKILHEVHLSVNAGEYVSVIGPNGAGKTTLIKCMAGIHSSWTGTFNLDGKPFSSYGTRERARLQGYVPQAEGRTIPLTVEEFVALGRYPHLSAFTNLNAKDCRTIDSAIAQAGLEPFRHRKMNTLSGGERQMAFIASALAQESKLLLLDEPSTFLDYRHQANVADVLATSCRTHGITIVAVHHDINNALAYSDRIHAIKDGRMVFEGTPAEAADPDRLGEIYDTPFASTETPHRSLPLITAGGAL